VEIELSQLLIDVNKDLADYEKLRMIVVSTQPWTIENGCLTPTMKIRRNRIEATLDARVADWYAKNSPVIWA
jgi:long-subunit acyl-CoA synthetase (AMP-forming)